jgi:hypothetical protein
MSKAAGYTVWVHGEIIKIGGKLGLAGKYCVDFGTDHIMTEIESLKSEIAMEKSKVSRLREIAENKRGEIHLLRVELEQASDENVRLNRELSEAREAKFAAFDNDRKIQATEVRAIEMLTIAASYIREHCPEMVVFYDEVECDGGCVADDCESVADDLALKCARGDYE